VSLRRIDRLSSLRVLGLLALLASPVLIAGCGAPKLETSAALLNDDKLPEKGDVDMAPADTRPPAQGQALNCPQVVAWPNERLRTVYQPGHDGDTMFVIHRGEITKLSRECQFFGSRVVVKYGFAGRVLLGPKGGPGTVTMPVKIRAAGANKETLATDKMSITTTVPQGSPVGYFSMVREIGFPLQVGTRPEDYKIFVAFAK
jgi:hypothetical protein